MIGGCTGLIAEQFVANFKLTVLEALGSERNADAIAAVEGAKKIDICMNNRHRDVPCSTKKTAQVDAGCREGSLVGFMA